MKKARNCVDANHVKEATTISSDHFASNTSSPTAHPADNKVHQHQQPPNPSVTGKGFGAQFPPPEKTGTDCASSSNETSSLETQGIVRRILANVNNSPIREEGFEKKPVCLAKRSPKAKPKTSVRSTVKVADATGPQRINETAEKITSDFSGRKESQDFSTQHGKPGTSVAGVANIHGDIKSGWKHEVRNQNIYSGVGKGYIDSIGKEDVSRSKARGDAQNTAKRGGVGGEAEGENIYTEKSTQQCSARRAIIKSDSNEKRNSLVEQKRLSSGKADERDANLGHGPEICSPPLPPSLSRDSGISSPSVDEVKPIDQRTDEPKDNEGPLRALKGERGNICSIHDDQKDKPNSKSETEVIKMSLIVNNTASSIGSSFDSTQAGDRAVCSELNLASYPLSATLPLSESIPCQGETNPVVSPLAPLVGQTDKAMVTALGIDEADTHASIDSRLVSSDFGDDEPATSANSVSVDETTTRLPARHLGPAGPASKSDSTTGGFATESSALVDQKVNTNKSGSGLAEQTTLFQISASHSGTNETCANSDVKQANTFPSSKEETSLESRVSLGDTLSITTSNTETTAAAATIAKTSATLSFIETVNSCEQRIEIEHNNKSTQYEHQQLDHLNQTENGFKEDHTLEDALGSNVRTHENYRQPLNSDCSSTSCNTDIVEKIKTAGVEEEGLHKKSETGDGTTKQRHTQEVITRDTEIITETCDIVTSIKSIESKDTSGPSQSEELDTLPPLKPKRARLNFRDINIQEVISLQSDSPGQKLKGILKSKSNECISGSSNCVRENGKEKLHSARSVSFKKTHTKSTFSYYNAAFEGEIKEEPSRRPSLADVVTHIMRTNSVVDIEEEEDNSHPYGRDNSLTDLINGKRRENINMDAGKMIVWLALAIMIVSLAGVIIFMSESYNLTHKEEVFYFPPDDTTLSHS